jgi:lactoylglutathione lyase
MSSVQDSLVSGLHHVGVTVSNLDEASRFFSALLDRTPYTVEFLNQVQEIDELTGYTGTRLHVAMLHIPGSSTLLELIEYEVPPSACIDMETFNVGNTHLCLQVRDIAAAFTRLRDTDVQFRSDSPVVEPDGPFAGCKWVYLRTPDGLTVELCEPPTR